MNDQMTMMSDLPTTISSHRGIPHNERYIIRSHRGIPLDNYATTQDSIAELAMITTQYFESIRLEAYGDYKQHSIGWGTRANHPSEVITLDEANRRFQEHFDKVYQQVSEEFPNLSDPQKYATTIFAYNVSIHQITSANVTPKKLRNGEKPPFHLWVNVTVGGKKQVLEGLVTRRNMESQIWDDWREVYNNHLQYMINSINSKIQKHA
jgi:GH24 family phage-related lysozyme (muramidase)